MNSELLSHSDHTINDLLKAAYPLIYVLSWEEERVEKGMLQIATDRGRKFLSWSTTEGVIEIRRDENGREQRVPIRSRDLRDPLRALEFIGDASDEALFVLRDFHPYMQDPTIVRRLRDLARYLKKSEKPKTLILLSAILKIPAELEKEVTVVDYELPGPDDLEAVIEALGRNSIVPSHARHEVSEGSSLRERIIEAALGLTINEAENVFSKSLVQKQRFDIDVILSEKEQIIRKSGILEFYHATEQFSDVGGLEELKRWLHKREKAFTKEAREFGLPRPKGILLIGVPGCGKSLTAKAVSSLWKLPLLRLDVGKIFAGLVGSSEENMRKAIKTAEAVAPSILWLDELEKGFSGTHSSSFSDAGTTARVFGSFVTWLQEKSSPVFVIATANNVTLLPPELMRKGRFDDIFFVDLPSREERTDIFRIHLQKRGRDPDRFDLDLLGLSSEGFSGSEIEQAIISALYDAFDAGRDLTTEDILSSFEETIPLSQTMEEAITALREWAAMSHFTKVQTKITDLDCLKQALEDLQYTCREGGVRVRGWRGQWSEADLAVDIGGPYNIGFRKAPQGHYEVVADWWGVEMRAGISQTKFVNDLNQRYAYHKVLSEVRRRGFSVAEDETLEDNTIRLVVRKWS